MAMKKGLDRCFLEYGIRQEDMQIVERVCQQDGVDAEWLKKIRFRPQSGTCGCQWRRC